VIFDGRNLYDPKFVRAAGHRVFRHRTLMNMLDKVVSHVRLLVVGDVMLDRYWFGEVSRISPEAPVPVVKVERSEERPGGAANVARNAAALGAGSRLLRWSATTKPGAASSADGEGGKSMPACTSTRRAQHDGQAARDRPPAAVVAHRFRERPDRTRSCAPSWRNSSAPAGLRRGDSFRLRQGRADAYQRNDPLARAAGKIVLVDPKGDDYASYAGATIITPNRSECAKWSGAGRTRRI
jgi:hypothetical protein